MPPDTLQLSLAEIQGLAKLERDMDTGTQPYVVVEGSRIAVQPEIMKRFGLESGQTVNRMLNLEIIKATIAGLRHKIGMKAAVQPSE